VLKSGFPLRRTDAPAACLISCFQSTSRVVSLVTQEPSA